MLRRGFCHLFTRIKAIKQCRHSKPADHPDPEWYLRPCPHACFPADEIRLWRFYPLIVVFRQLCQSPAAAGSAEQPCQGTMLCNLICHHPPDKTRQFPCGCRHCHIFLFPMPDKFIIPASQPGIPPVCIRYDFRRIAILPCT